MNNSFQYEFHTIQLLSYCISIKFPLNWSTLVIFKEDCCQKIIWYIKLVHPTPSSDFLFFVSYITLAIYSTVALYALVAHDLHHTTILSKQANTILNSLKWEGDNGNLISSDVLIQVSDNSDHWHSFKNVVLFLS